MCCIGIHVPVFNCFSNEICHSFLHPLDSMALVSQFPLWAMTAETRERFVCRRMCCLAVNSFRRPEIADEWCNFTHSSIVSLDTWCQSRNRSNQSWCLMVLTSTINLSVLFLSHPVAAPDVIPCLLRLFCACLTRRKTAYPSDQAHGCVYQMEVLHQALVC